MYVVHHRPSSRCKELNECVNTERWHVFHHRCANATQVANRNRTGTPKSKCCLCLIAGTSRYLGAIADVISTRTYG